MGFTPTDDSTTEYSTQDPSAVEADALLELGDQIVELAAHLHAGTQRMLTLVAKFDERGGWKAGGHRSCADWLAYRTGFDLGACREKVRAARALLSLPLISDAMAAGELSFAKVRALTRVANAESEAELLEFARAGTARHVEQLVRSWKLLGRVDEQERERILHRSRTVTVVPDEDGMYVIRGRLDPEVGALLMRAIEAASDALYTASSGDCEDVTSSQRRADAIGLLAERALQVGLSAEADLPTSGSRAERYQVVLHVDPETLDADAEPGMSKLADGTRVSAETSRRLSCDASVVRVTTDDRGQVLDVGRRTRTIPPAIRRALDVRDGGCRFPGCGLRFTDAHHVVHWADGGDTKLDNLVLLCRHHHRLVHEGGWSVAGGVGALEFVGPHGRVVRRVGLVRSDDPVGELVRGNEAVDEKVAFRGPTARWKGDAEVEVGMLVGVLEALDVAAET